nr:MAG TPA: hypothetical protein [Caudoviricetes sp.]
MVCLVCRPRCSLVNKNRASKCVRNWLGLVRR